MANPKNLNLGDESLPGRPEPDFQKWLDCIETMRGEGCWEWADSTLTGIYDGVYERKFITENQKQAIRNIRDRCYRVAQDLDIDHL